MDLKQIKVHVTEAQFAAESLAIKESGLTASEFRRLALKKMIASYGIEFPDDMPQHGGKREKSN